MRTGALFTLLVLNVTLAFCHQRTWVDEQADQLTAFFSAGHTVVTPNQQDLQPDPRTGDEGQPTKITQLPALAPEFPKAPIPQPVRETLEARELREFMSAHPGESIGKDDSGYFVYHKAHEQLHPKREPRTTPGAERVSAVSHSACCQK